VRFYELDEAKLLLPRVIPVLEKLQAAYRELRALQASVAAESRGASGDGHLLVNPWAEEEGKDQGEALSATLQNAAAQLDRWGIELKDPEKGLIDFFHQRDGRTVYLCYLLGEPSIEYWHDLDAGFAGRQPL
jgi:hypothetical protein